LHRVSVKYWITMFFMDEKKIIKALKLVDTLETAEDVIINIADKYTVEHSDESYKRNKEMLTEFAQRMGLIKKNG